MSLTAIAIALVAYMGLGMAQMFQQKRVLQNIADASAMTAASQLGDGPGFTAAQNVATANGAQAGEVAIQCVTQAGALSNCQTASRARVTVTRQFKPLFYSNSQTVVAVAEAGPAPLVVGVLNSSLVNLNTQQSALLNGLVNAIGGGNVNLSLVSWQGLLGAGLQVNLLDLSTRLNAGSAQNLTNLSLGLGDFLNAAVGVANGASNSAAQLTVNSLATSLNAVNLNVGEILAVGLGNQDAGRVNVPLGDLALSAILAGANGRAASVGLNTGGLGITTKVYVVEPPQLIIGRKREGAPFVAYGRTAQVKIELNSKGLTAPLGVPGIVGASISALNLSVYVQAGGAQATVKDIQCKIPRSSNQTLVNLSSSAATVCVGGRPSNFADDNTTPITCPAPANILNADLTVLLVPIRLQVAAKAYTSLDSLNNDVTLTGKAPLSTSATFRADGGLGSLLKTLDLNLSVGASIAALNLGGLVSGALNALISPLLSFVAQTLAPVLDTVGGVLDSLLGLLGVSIGQSTLQLNTLDCSNTVLYR